jgi:hypothetical protein
MRAIYGADGTGIIGGIDWTEAIFRGSAPYTTIQGCLADDGLPPAATSTPRAFRHVAIPHLPVTSVGLGLANEGKHDCRRGMRYCPVCVRFGRAGINRVATVAKQNTDPAWPAVTVQNRNTTRQRSSSAPDNTLRPHRPRECVCDRWRTVIAEFEAKLEFPRHLGLPVRSNFSVSIPIRRFHTDRSRRS